MFRTRLSINQDNIWLSDVIIWGILLHSRFSVSLVSCSRLLSSRQLSNLSQLVFNHLLMVAWYGACYIRENVALELPSPNEQLLDKSHIPSIHWIICICRYLNFTVIVIKKHCMRYSRLKYFFSLFQHSNGWNCWSPIRQMNNSGVDLDFKNSPMWFTLDF